MNQKTIAEAVLSSCKALIASPIRADAQRILRSQEHNGSFGYLARGVHEQFLGYLLIDAAQETGPTEFVHLTPEEAVFLGRLHSAWLSLNRRCMLPIVERRPEFEDALNPYNRFGQVRNPPDDPDGLISRENADSIASIFPSHPAMNTILNTDVRIGDRQAYAKKTEEMISSLMKSGPFEAPNWTRALVSYGANDVRREPLRQLIATVALRQSLAVMNQLLFQAVTQDKLSALTTNNVFGLGQNSRHFAGDGVELFYQPNKEAFVLEPNQVVKVALKDVANIDALGWVDHVNMNYSVDEGTRITVAMRLLGQDLNPFGPLLRIANP
ncbi:MAG: hypothetical protein Q7K03_10540 [Dehalococcoidia bacterium]|nr:hypothetical protein [Dehalococcoidia bacterium]